MFRLVCLSLLVLSSACITNVPYLMSSTDTPTNGSLRLGSPVTAQSCRSFVFGVIPIEVPYSSRTLLDRARGDADALVRISWDKKVKNYLLYQEICDVVYATKAYYETDAPSSTAASTRTASGLLVTSPQRAQTPAAPVERGMPIQPEDADSVDAIMGLDGRSWGNTPWIGLRDMQVSPRGKMADAAVSEGILETLAFDRLRYGFDDEGMNEIRFRTDQSAVDVFEGRFGPPTTRDGDNAEWTGTQVSVDVRDRNVRIRRL